MSHVLRFGGAFPARGAFSTGLVLSCTGVLRSNPTVRVLFQPQLLSPLFSQLDYSPLNGLSRGISHRRRSPRAFRRVLPLVPGKDPLCPCTRKVCVAITLDHRESYFGLGWNVRCPTWRGWIGLLTVDKHGYLHRVLDVVSSRLFRLSSLPDDTEGEQACAWGSNEYKYSFDEIVQTGTHRTRWPTATNQTNCDFGYGS